VPGLVQSLVGGEVPEGKHWTNSGRMGESRGMLFARSAGIVCIQLGLALIALAVHRWRYIPEQARVLVRISGREGAPRTSGIERMCVPGMEWNEFFSILII
jgi:hypothetical protein